MNKQYWHTHNKGKDDELTTELWTDLKQWEVRTKNNLGHSKTVFSGINSERAVNIYNKYAFHGMF